MLVMRMLMMRGCRGRVHFIVLWFIVSVFANLGLHVYMFFVVEVFGFIVSEAVSIKHFSCLLSGLTTP
jgi:hypothetical protein